MGVSTASLRLEERKLSQTKVMTNARNRLVEFMNNGNFTHLSLQKKFDLLN